MDNQWLGTRKQRLGVIVAPWYVQSLFEAVFLPGERQATFARRLGFSDAQIWQGLFCPDTASLTGASGARQLPLPRVFGYLGRLSPEKGLQDLLQAFEIYSVSDGAPWSLNVAGAGPLDGELDSRKGVLRSGFVQPTELSGWFKTIGCLVVPSRVEAWGVALSEGATAGLPIIATDACGAVPHLVHDFANGRIARTSDPHSLAASLSYIATLPDERRLAMGNVSQALARPYTPTRWADTVVTRSVELLATGRSQG